MSVAALIDLSRERAYLRDLGRAFGGALVFSIPLLMTMEMSVICERTVAATKLRNCADDIQCTCTVADLLGQCAIIPKIA